MKVIKPNGLSILYKVYEDGGDCYFVISSLGMFSFNSPGVILPEVDLWKFVAEELGSEGILDICMPKKSGELIVMGRCFAPEGLPVAMSSVSVHLGPINKTLNVFGDRFWEKEWLDGSKHTYPVPFTEMDITWENAFGGEGFQVNPVGKGFPTEKMKKWEEPWPLPNIEDHDNLIVMKEDTPDPAGFRTLDIMNPVRMAKLGTYDEVWRKERFPGYPEDMDWTYFNGTQQDQWVERFFRGDEEFSVLGMNVEKQTLYSNLPSVKARCFITRHNSPGKLEEVLSNLDTVWLFPHAERGIILYRGVVKISTDDAEDVAELMAGFEKLNEPKTREHYETVYTKRMDKEHGGVYSLMDEDLMPQEEKIVRTGDIDQLDELTTPEFIFQRKAMVKAQKELDKHRDMLKSSGIDPDKYLPSKLPAPKELSFEEKVKFLTRDSGKIKADIEKQVLEQRSKLEAQARETMKKVGVDFDQLVKKVEAENRGAPKFPMNKQLDSIQKMAESIPALKQTLADKDFSVKMAEAEEDFQKNYKRFAHLYPPATPLDDAQLVLLKKEIEEKGKAGFSFAEWDFTGIDLSGLDLSGVDFRDAYMEGANLSGANLCGADLTRTVLARANLSDTDLRSARLLETNFGEAKLHNTRIEKADLSGAVFVKADCEGAIFTNSDFGGIDPENINIETASNDRADFSGAKLKNCNMSGISVSMAQFIETDLEGAKFCNSDLSKALFYKANLKGTDFSGADLSQCQFVESIGPESVFDGARMNSSVFAKGTSLPDSSFKRVNAFRANFRGTNLENADFRESSLNESDLSQCNLRNANMDMANMVRTRFEKSDMTGASIVFVNLTEGSLLKTRLDGADLSDSNMFGAEFFKVNMNNDTVFLRANLKRTKLTANEETDK